MKERVTLTIDSELLAEVDSRIDKEMIKNRSHAVELLLRNSLRGNIPQLAVILAGGDEKACLQKIKGKPVIEHNLDLLKGSGVKKAIITTKAKSLIKKRLSDYEGLIIEYFEEKEPLGTAGCLRELNIENPFIMLNGDEIKDINLQKLFLAHNNHEANATIALTTVNNPKGYGVAILDGNHIMRFEEKPNETRSFLVNSGIYIIEPEIIREIPEGFAMLEEAVFPKLAREHKLYGYPFSGQWFSLNTKKEKEKAEEEWNGFQSI